MFILEVLFQFFRVQLQKKISRKVICLCHIPPSKFFLYVFNIKKHGEKISRATHQRLCHSSINANTISQLFSIVKSFRKLFRKNFIIKVAKEKSLMPLYDILPKKEEIHQKNSWSEELLQYVGLVKYIISSFKIFQQKYNLFVLTFKILVLLYYPFEIFRILIP